MGTASFGRMRDEIRVLRCDVDIAQNRLKAKESDMDRVEKTLREMQQQWTSSCEAHALLQQSTVTLQQQVSSPDRAAKHIDVMRDSQLSTQAEMHEQLLKDHDRLVQQNERLREENHTVLLEWNQSKMDVQRATEQSEALTEQCTQQKGHLESTQSALKQLQTSMNDKTTEIQHLRADQERTHHQILQVTQGPHHSICPQHSKQLTQDKSDLEEKLGQVMEERRELSRRSEVQGLQILDAQRHNAKLLARCASVQDSAVEWMGQMDRCRCDNEQQHQQILHLEAKSIALSAKTSTDSNRLLLRTLCAVP